VDLQEVASGGEEGAEMGRLSKVGDNTSNRGSTMGTGVRPTQKSSNMGCKRGQNLHDERHWWGWAAALEDNCIAINPNDVYCDRSDGIPQGEQSVQVDQPFPAD
jgi:hypothetical protein